MVDVFIVISNYFIGQLEKAHEDEEETLQEYDYQQQDKSEDIAAAEESQKVSLTTNYKISKPVLNIKEEYERVKYLENLPVDLDFLQKNPLEKIVPEEIQVIKPVEISLIDNRNTKAKVDNTVHNRPAKRQPVVPYTPQKVLPNNRPKPTEPTIKTVPKNVVVESGFKPMRTNNNLNSHSVVRNSYQPEKKPQNTPGLKHFSTTLDNNKRYNNNNNQKKVNYEYNYLPIGRKGFGGRDRPRTELTRLYRSANKDGYTRYAKRILLEGV